MSLFLKKLVRGFAGVFAFVCALLMGAESITSIGDYKVKVNEVLGGAAASAGSADSYEFMSDYESLQEMLTERQRIAEQLAEEGCVLFKNDNDTLPLRKDNTDGSALNVTVLGSRAYTYKANGSLRDDRLLFYGGYTGSRTYQQKVTTDEGTISLPVTVEDSFAGQKININPAMKTFYSDFAFPPILEGSEGTGDDGGNVGGAYESKEPKVEKSNCGDTATYSDACFVVLGRSSGEGRDYYPGSFGVKGGDGSTCAIGLNDNERHLIEVAHEISDKVIVLINSGVAMEINELKEGELADMIDSVLWIGLPGAFGMNGVARVISGVNVKAGVGEDGRYQTISPSGHITDLHAVAASNSPAAQNFGIKTQDGTLEYTWDKATASHSKGDDSHYVVMAEGIYTGYKYYESRYADCVNGVNNASDPKGAVAGASSWKYEDEVVYTFGYGLSYTTFSQKIVDGSYQYDEGNKSFSLDVEVENTGDTYSGKDVVQLYVQTPYTDYDKEHGVEKSAIQLASFEKTNVLAPGEKQTVTVTVDLKYIASYDKTVSHNGMVGGYILDEGTYYFALGNGAHEALNNVLAKQGVETANLYIENGSYINENGVYEWIPSGDEGFSFDKTNKIDSTYFAVSDTDAVISNQLENVNYNYYNTTPSEQVQFLSRTNWSGTFPKSYPGLKEMSGMKDYLDDNVYKFSTSSSNVEFGVDHEEDAEEGDENARNVTIAMYKGAAYDDPTWDTLIEQITFDEAWAFSPYGGASCNKFKSVAAPDVYQIDGPNGNLTRPYSALAPTSGTMGVSKSDPNANYTSNDMPAAPMIGATFNKELEKERGLIYGEDNLWSRNPIMWAPGSNLHRCPFNSRNHEYYSEDPVLTTYLSAEVVEGGVEKGSILAAKHFAFNSQESYREGLIQFMEEQSARENELRGFQGIIEDVAYDNVHGNTIGTLGLMSSFSRAGVSGVNTHTGLMVNILRKEWGFKGLISTDMVVGANYFNPQDSIINNVTFMATTGADALLEKGWKDYNNKAKVMADGKMMTALYENMHYYMYVLANSCALNGIDADTKITETKEWWQEMISNGIMISGVLAGLMAVAGVLLSVRGEMVVQGGKDDE